ncbi:MAG: antitoxin [Chloroflexi bacterium]|nr:MAG: antitoxin [Chloroflexota bacterium]
MTLLLNHPEVDELAQAISAYTGETAVQATVTALRERLERERRKHLSPGSLKENLLRIGRECAMLPLLDRRTPDEILGYDEKGLPA